MSDHPAEKSIIFTEYVDELAYLKYQLEQEDYPVYEVSGSTKGGISPFKDHKVEPNHKAPVILMQIKCGSAGLNLQQATRVYFMGPNWNPASEMQAIARSWRVGQTKPVFVKKLFYDEQTDNLHDRVISIEREMVGLQLNKA